MQSTEQPTLAPAEREQLLQLAGTSIDYGLQAHDPPAVALGDFPAALREIRGSFVTLYLDGALRGCIGTLAPYRPLPEDVCANAFAAAFRDPRFKPVTRGERDTLEISISILSPKIPMNFADETELLAQLRPDLDGLIIEQGDHKATFLPSVWSSLPEPRAFLDQLKRKAGLHHSRATGTLKAWRYTTENFS